MPKRLENGMWECAICKSQWSRDVYAVSCEQSHEIIYVPFKREDLFKLMNFIRTKDDKLITESLWNTLRKYSKGVV